MGLWSMVTVPLVPGSLVPGPLTPSIALKELVLIVLAAASWGECWKGLFILCHSDNSAVFSQVPHAWDPLACNMLHCLGLFQANFDFHL